MNRTKLIIFLFSFIVIIPLIADGQGIEVTWSEPEIISEFARANCWCVKIIGWGDAVYVAWMREQSHNRTFFCSSFDRGTTWELPLQITPWEHSNIASDSHPDIAVWEGNLYCAEGLEDGNIPIGYHGTAFTASSDSGYTWWEEMAYIMDEGHRPAVSVWEDTVVVVMHGEGNTYSMRSTDGGLNFSPPQIISQLIP
jgi:hypothetical protein